MKIVFIKQTKRDNDMCNKSTCPFIPMHAFEVWFATKLDAQSKVKGLVSH